MNKNVLAIAALMFLASACNNPSADKSGNKLESLKKEREKLNSQIQKLEAAKGPDTTVNIVTVAIENLKPQTFNHYLEVQGRVESNSNIFLTAKVPGAIVTSVLVNRGDNVKKGQVLAKMDASVLEQNIIQLKGQLNLVRTVFEKQKNLWNQKIGSEIQFLTAKNNYESLKNNLNVLQQQADMYVLRSPINGTVDDVTIKAGEIPAPGISGIRVVNPDDVKITADISEAYISKVKKGDQVKVYLPDMGKELETKVKTVGRVINATNRTFSIELDPQGAKTELRPNMIAILKINDYVKKDALVLPINLVQTDESGKFVYVAVPNGNEWKASRKVITTGENYQGKTEIISGLTPEDNVIVSGYQSVVEGQRISLGK